MRSAPSKLERSSTAVLIAVRAAATAIALLLHGCATPAHDPPKPAIRPKSVSTPSPPLIKPELMELIHVAMARRLSVSTADLAASTHVEELAGLRSDKPVYLSRTEGSHCIAGNCAYGLFVEERGQLRELYFARLASPPRVMRERHLGVADLATTALADDTQLRAAGLRWDGNDYVEISCSLVSRVTGASRPCAAVAHDQIVTEPRVPATLCEQVKTMLSRPLNRIQTQTMMSNSFLVRGDSDNHVEAIKVRGNVTAPAKRLLIACARARGTAELLELAESPRASANDRPADIVRLRVRGVEVNAVDLTFGLAFFKRSNVTLVTVGVSAVTISAR